MAGKKDKIKDSERFSIIAPLDKCFITGTKADNLHLHEVFGGPNRSKSKEDGLVIALTPYMHNMSSSGIHFNKALDLKVKQRAQKIWMKTYCDSEGSEEDHIKDFIKRYGKNFL